MSAPIIITLVIFQFAYPGGLPGVGLDLVTFVGTSCADLALSAIAAMGLATGFFGAFIGAIILWVLIYLSMPTYL